MTERRRSAARRMAGLIGVFTGSAVLLFLVTFPPRIAEAFQEFPVWTTWVVVSEAVCASTVLAAGITGRARLQRISAGALAVSYCLSSVWMLALRALGHGVGVDVVWHEAYPSIIIIGLLPFLPLGTATLLSGTLFTVVGLLAVGDPGRDLLGN